MGHWPVNITLQLIIPSAGLSPDAISIFYPSVRFCIAIILSFITLVAEVRKCVDCSLSTLIIFRISQHCFEQATDLFCVSKCIT